VRPHPLFGRATCYMASDPPTTQGRIEVPFSRIAANLDTV
jgi:hypothetical protein